jgi:hypothetical protein
VLRTLALVLIPAIVVGAGAWFLASVLGGGDGDGQERASGNISNVINAFSQGGEGTTVHRYEGELPPGYPEDVPEYPGAELIASLVQLGGGSAGYLVVYDTKDNRDDVAAYFQEQFDQDPWQVDAGRDTRDSALAQFSKIDDADITGLVLSADSLDNDLTTIVVSIQVASGADAINEDFEPGVTKPLPQGFPEELPQYPDSVIIESAFQNEPRASSYIVSFVTRDSVANVMDFYRDDFQQKQWTVTDGDTSNSSLQEAEGIDFTTTSDEGDLTGNVTAGEFAEDENYTQVDLVVNSTQQ